MTKSNWVSEKGGIMETIERFYHRLNADGSDRFTRWRPYRDEITTMIQSHLSEGTRVASLLVLGAGNCDDVDLNALSILADTLTLADIDAEAMAVGVRKYEVPADRIALIPLDFLGFPAAGFFAEARAFLNRPFSHKDLRRFWQRVTVPLTMDRFPPGFTEAFDIIILTPIYTQFILPLVTTWLASIDASQVPKDRRKTFIEGLLEILPRCIDRFNAAISRLLKATGVCFAWSDIFQTQIGSTFDAEVQKALATPASMDALYDGYFSRYGFGSGDYGLFSLEAQLEKNFHRWLSWPFTEKERMIVKFEMLTKRG